MQVRRRWKNLCVRVAMRLRFMISVFRLTLQRKLGLSHGHGWKWSDDAEHHALQNRVSEYSTPASARLSYEAEIEEWITNGWLEPCDDKKLGPAKGLIPLMAIVQQNKGKVRPVMDFRELNLHVEAFIASADVCADTIREWRPLGTNVAIVDLRRA